MDENDSSLATFFAYLVAALRTAYPEAGHSSSAVLAGPSDAQPELLATLFLNDLEGLGGPLVLVLDDDIVAEVEIPAATIEGNPIDACANAPKIALGPRCGGVVVLRRRRRSHGGGVTYFWRHQDHENRNCTARFTAVRARRPKRQSFPIGCATVENGQSAEDVAD